MFFIVSKVFWAVAQPLSLIILLGVLALLMLWLKRRKTAGFLLTVSVLIAFLCSCTTLGNLAIRPLEDRFPRPAEPPDDVAAIVVLGGGFNGKASKYRLVEELRESGDRFVEAVALARQYPDAKVVISGGFGSIFQEGETDAVIAERFYPRLGIPLDRLVLEGESRNTAENASMVRDLIGTDSKGAVILVTSAFHMPRSVGLFRAAGVTVVPWPVDYRSLGAESFWFDFDNPVENLFTSTTAMREWIGLVVYRLTGQIADVLPGPEGEP